MLKRMTLLAKREDLDAKAFRAHWAGHHAELALSLPGVCKYEQNRIDEELLSIPSGNAFSADGIVELFFTDAETMQLAQASDTGRRKIPDDEPLFLRGWSLNIVETDDPHDYPGIKVMAPITLRDRSKLEAAAASWRAIARTAGAIQTSVNTVVSSHVRPHLWHEPIAPDLILVCWFETAKAARQAFAYDGTLCQAIEQDTRLASVYLCDTLTIK